MSPVTHFLAGWMVAQFTERGRARDRTVVTLAGVAPDLDGLGIIPEVVTRNTSHPLPWFSEYHHVLGHNLGFALAVTAATYFFCGRRWKTALLVLLSFHLHLLFDLVGARGPDGYQWPIPMLAPFSNAFELTWSGQWQLNGWQNFAITFVLLALTLRLALLRGFSPVSLFSNHADHVVVETLKRRFDSQSGTSANSGF
jgi:inner membrane protein